VQLSVVLALTLASSLDPKVVDDLIGRTPGMVTQPTMMSKTEAGGVNVLQRTCISKERPAELKAFFTLQFKKAGFYIAPEQNYYKPERGEQITALDTETLVAYSAILQQSDKMTTVVIAAADVGMQSMAQGKTPIAPVFPGGHDLMAYKLEMMSAMVYMAPGTPADIKAFYRDVLKKEGFAEDEDMVFWRKNQRMTVVVAPGVTERQVMVQLETAPIPKNPAPAGAPSVTPSAPTPAAKPAPPAKTP
jgi:hypothetical protein